MPDELQRKNAILLCPPLSPVIQKLNEICEKSWLELKCYYIPSESQSYFILSENHQVFFKAQIFVVGQYALKITYNGCFYLAYPEDAAFALPIFKAGSQVNWDTLEQHLRWFVEISNIRQNQRYYPLVMKGEDLELSEAVA